MIFKKVKHRLAQNNFLANMYRLKYINLDLIYNPMDLNLDYYNKVVQTGVKELEHQIGRLNNFKNILCEIEQNNLNGEIIEFGTWKGFSLLWITYLAERLGIFNKKYVGVDCFEGLPNDEGAFKKGAFKDTSLKECVDNIRRNKNLYEVTKKNIFIEKFFFSQKNDIAKRLTELGINKFCFIHIDSDISSSVKEIFIMLNDLELLSNVNYILFDDYACVDSYKDTVDKLVGGLKDKWTIEVHSNTRFTKNFKLIKK